MYFDYGQENNMLNQLKTFVISKVRQRLLYVGSAQGFLSHSVPQISASLMANFCVFENLRTEGLTMVGKEYGLSPTCLWKATRRVNAPEVRLDNADDC